MDMTNCRNCGSIINENFCSHCGQGAKLKRIDAHYISHEIQHLLHFEKGFPHTVKELIVRPGQSIREYITNDRNKHIKPIPFLILASLLYTLISHYFHIEEGFIEHSEAGNAALNKTSVSVLFKWVQNHYGYANILMGGFIALWIKLFFRKYQYNLFEITVLLCFVMGEGMLILAVSAAVAGLLNNLFIFEMMGYVIFLYTTLAIGQFFEKKKPISYIKALLSYSLGTASFYLALIVIGLLYDVITK